MNAVTRIIFAVVWLSLAGAGWWPGRAQTAPSTLPNLQLADGGTIKAMALQEDGKLIVAGRFSAVNGVPRRNIARINPNGSVDQTWAPWITTRPKEFDYGVLTMCLVGDRLFIGGTFSAVGGLPRAGLAKISISGDGEPDALWNPAPSNGGNTFFDYKTFALVSDGTALFVGGKFRFIGGAARPGLAKLAVDGAGAADPGWVPAPPTLTDKGITALALNGPYLYAAARNPDPTHRIGDLFRVSTGNGSVDAGWHPGFVIPEFFIDAIVVSATDVFAGGYSYLPRPGSTGPSSLKIERAMVWKFNASGSGATDPAWQPAIAGANDADPDTETNVTALALDGGSLFVGGVFASVGGTARRDLVKISTSGTGVANAAWRADADLAKDDHADVEAFIIRGSQLIAGGSFRRINGEVALGIVPLDTISGAFGDRYRAQVQFPAFVTAIARQADGKLVLGGNFFVANGLARHGLVRVNTDGSVDTGWDPATEDAQINDIAIVGNDIFVAGTFATLGGQPRNGLAKLSALGPDTADPDWNPNVEGYVGAIMPMGSQLYLAGDFDSVGGATIHGLARVSATGTGALDAAWRPPVSKLREVVSVLVSNTGVFAGSFPAEIGASGPSLQKFSLTTGAPDARFRTSLTRGISALALDGPWLYAGGDRTLARVKADTGAPDARFKIVPNKDIVTLRISGSKLYAGGIFSRIGGVARAGLARIDTTGNGRVDRDWNPRPAHIESGRPGSLGYFGVLPSIISLRVEGDTVLAGGEFDTIGGEPRLSFASLAVAHAPVVLQTPDGIVISRNAADGAEVTHFRFTRIAGGRLFLHDGITPIAEDDFISVEKAAEGLIFQPASGPSEPSRLVVVSALNDRPGGAGTASTFVDLATLQTLPEFVLDRASYAVEEGAGSITIEIRKTGGTAGEVDFSTSDGSALAGVNYTAVATRLVFGAGDTSKTVNIAIANNTVFQGDRAFRVALSATSSGALGEPSSASVKIIDDDAVGTTGSRTVIEIPNPAAPPASAGELAVTLSPAQANGQWRPSGDPLWHDSGAVVTGLASGNYAVEFRAVNGFRVPDPLIVAVLSGVRTNTSTTYTAISAGAQAGLLAAMLTPGFAADPATPEASRAQWRRQGEATWHNSGEIVSLNSGVYVIEFKTIPSLFSPPAVTVEVAPSQTNSVTGAYLVAETPAAPKPQLLTLAQATAQQPFLFNGQIKVDDGFASGCVVQKHVVLTAAHVLFDDESLSFATDVKWFFQRQRGQYEPPPQTPRGSYVQEGYAAQRASDGAAQEPGISTPASQMLDIATMFFLDPPGRGGSGGYLTSDAPQNEWLTTARNKMLIGYPIDGVPDNDRGKMHATAAADLAFTRLYQPGQPVYATTGIAAFPGNSGGPLCAQFSDGNYYPAAVYLGGTAQTLVRAIDSTAVALINRAETSGNGGGNNVSGGTTIVGPGFGAGQFAPATLACDLGPSTAITAGAGWRLADAVGYQGRNAKFTLAAGRFRVEFKPVPGFITPTSREVEVIAGQNTVIDGAYRAAASAIISARRVHASLGEVFQYRIIATNNATVFGASNLPAGLTINVQTGVISGAPLKVGTFESSVTADAASAPLTILVEKPGTLAVVVSGRGTVTNGFEGKSTRFVGRRYTINATPAPDMLFDSWSGDIPAVTPALTFTMEDGLVLRANFVPNPYLTRLGSYLGLLESGTTPAGRAALSLGRTGHFTLGLVLGHAGYSLVGKFDLQGGFTGRIRRLGRSSIDVTLHLDFAAPGVSTIVGTIMADGITYDLAAMRAGFTPPPAGKFTVTLPPDPTQTAAASYPQGYGYALVTVGASGKVVSAVGKLGDGQSFSVGGRFADDLRWAIYIQPYASGTKGLLGGEISFHSATAPAIARLDGTLDWSKPAIGAGLYAAGFAGSIASEGSSYRPSDVAALGITGWNLTIGAGVLPAPLVGTATLGADNRFTFGGAASGAVTLTLDAATGLIRGTARAGGGVAKPIKGVLLPGQRQGRGVLSLPGSTGSLTLDPP